MDAKSRIHGIGERWVRTTFSDREIEETLKVELGRQGVAVLGIDEKDDAQPRSAFADK